ncbi:protein OXIDATIVE STRESS 3 LIKE 4 [Elaeis guineensis]|uniref:Uncharacterized protein LOC105050836 n=1 Tax=Elaeis guineensis var. tenera TaxID=51953 RepID=A0A6I9RMH6_ELAGV|nr:uncharacterized protein LOC105050836 [Elaeis guineensis]
MSLVFAGVEVVGGPTVGLKDHVTIPVYLQQHGDNNNDHKGEEEKGKRKERNGFFIEEKVVEEESSETSSIGVQSSDSSSEKEEEDEVQSKAKNGAFGSLVSLEESLPIKRGLSNFFSGKSKSFASLADVATSTARDLVKPENPFNKRRRLLMASRTRRASYASFMTCLPPLSSDHIAEEIEKEEEEDEDERNSGDSSTLAPLPPHVSRERKIKKAFRSPRSFSLSDLQNV